MSFLKIAPKIRPAGKLLGIDVKEGPRFKMRIAYQYTQYSRKLDNKTREVIFKIGNSPATHRFEQIKPSFLKRAFNFIKNIVVK